MGWWLVLAVAGIVGTTVDATRFLAGSDQLVDAPRNLYVAYIIEDTDIMVKKVCQCVLRRDCHSRNNIQLTE